jgi:uncharacterized protein YhaN
VRILELELIAFGPFAGESLVFGKVPGIDLVYGANEAGKSTSLRAITGLLYGVPERTADAHRHPHTGLRIAATLGSASGGELRVVRRKGRKGTLFDSSGNALDEADLQRMLGGVSQSMFRNMFGLDHRGLREGAEALLAGKGEVGESLFDAAGARGVQEVLAALRSEADAIYRAKAQHPRLNDALKRLEDARDRVMLSSVGGESYALQQSELDQTRRAHEDAVGLRQRLMTENGRLERALRVIPALARHRELSRAMAQVQEVRLLPQGARAERLTRVHELDAARLERERLTREIAELEGRAREFEAVACSIARLDDASIADLSDRLGAFRRARADLPRRAAELATLREQARAKLRQIGRDSFELAGNKLAELRIDKLIAEHARQSERVAQAERAVLERESKRRAIEERLKEITAAPDLLGLRPAVERAVRHGDLDGARAVARSRVRDTLAEVERLFAASPWSTAAGDRLARIREIVAWPTPSAPEVDRFADTFAELGRESALLASGGDELRRRHAEVTTALEALEASCELPSEAELEQARTTRDGLLARLEGDWQGFIARYLGALAEADSVADRLRREADRVVERARLVAEKNASERARAELETAMARVARQHDEQAAALQGMFCAWGVTPRDPLHARSSIDRRDELVVAVAAYDRAKGELRLREEEIAALREAIARGLAPLGVTLEQTDGLAAALDQAEPIVRARIEAEQRRVVLEQTASDCAADEHEARAHLTQCARELDDWRARWARAVEPLGLPGDAAVEEASLVVATLREVHDKLEVADALERRIDGMERDNRAFRAEVAALAREHASDLKGASEESAALELRERHRRARSARDELERIGAELAAKAKERGDAVAREERASEALAACMSEAKVTDLEALDRAFDLSDRKRDISRQLAELEDQLLELGDGATYEELTTLTLGIDVDAARARIVELEAELATVNDDIDSKSRVIGNLQHTLRHNFEERSGAFREAGELESCVSEVRRHAEQWARLRLATVLLQQAIERYRAQHEAPILARANLLFSRLTLGSFRELKVDTQGEENRLRCVRTSGATTSSAHDEVELLGLSEGTRDQLYLALRLATLERFAEESESMPLVLDDLLINFDDARAKAALSVLFELADKVQVLFFTHHEHLIELAREVAPDGKLRIHRLRETSPVRREPEEQPRPA